MMGSETALSRSPSAAMFAGPKTIWRSRLWNRNIILPGADSASLLGDELENRRNQLRATLPIRRVVEPADEAALAVHIMTNTALTGATYDIDGGQQLVAA
jgi:NAD(P)-dependent dehydrogenase (short-subunit alcohol dehydrogenase family)